MFAKGYFFVKIKKSRNLHLQQSSSIKDSVTILGKNVERSGIISEDQSVLAVFAQVPDSASAAYTSILSVADSDRVAACIRTYADSRSGLRTCGSGVSRRDTCRRGYFDRSGIRPRRRHRAAAFDIDPGDRRTPQ